jgi:hypothetical protein
VSKEGLTSAAAESVYVLPNDVSPDAITKSLQALLRPRHQSIASHRFTILDTFDGRGGIHRLAPQRPVTILSNSVR